MSDDKALGRRRDAAGPAGEDAGAPIKFTSAVQWRRWLERHHDKETVVWLVFAKKGSGKKTLTYDEALDDEYYLFRFVPRKASSTWSQVNLDKFAKLEKAGKMTDAGRAAKPKGVKPPPRRFQSDDEIPYFVSHELALHPVAREFWTTIPPSHRRNYVRWITEAKQEETRKRRLERAIAALNARQKQFNM